MHETPPLFCGLSLVLCTLFACSRSDSGHTERSDASPSVSARPVLEAGAPEPDALPPLQGAWLERLELPSGQVVFVAPPIGARAPRPVIVAVHGAGDRPDWACGGWRLGTQAYAFVVCPQGHPMSGQTFGWPSGAAILGIVDAALPAVRARYGAHVADVPAIYAGFSQGAELAATTLLKRASTFPLAVFAEGGYKTTADAGFARQYRAAGGLRALLVCGNPNCFVHAERAVRLLEAAGIEGATAGDAKSGHNLNEPMQLALRQAWPDFVRGRPGWEAYPTGNPAN